MPEEDDEPDEDDESNVRPRLCFHENPEEDAVETSAPRRRRIEPSVERPSIFNDDRDVRRITLGDHDFLNDDLHNLRVVVIHDAFTSVGNCLERLSRSVSLRH